MKKEIYICDICGQEIQEGNRQKLILPFDASNEKETLISFNELDFCLNCCYKLAILLKEQKFISYPEPETEKIEQVEGEVIDDSNE